MISFSFLGANDLPSYARTPHSSSPSTTFFVHGDSHELVTTLCLITSTVLLRRTMNYSCPVLGDDTVDMDVSSPTVLTP
jgi:hypothetical protein